MKEYDKDDVLYPGKGGRGGYQSITIYGYDLIDHLHWMTRKRGYERMWNRAIHLTPLLHACSALEAYFPLFSNLFVFLQMVADTLSIYLY